MKLKNKLTITLSKETKITALYRGEIVYWEIGSRIIRAVTKPKPNFKGYLLIREVSTEIFYIDFGNLAELFFSIENYIDNVTLDELLNFIKGCNIE